MVYEHDEQAREEAAKYGLTDSHLTDLRALVAVKREQLGPEGVRGHSIPYDGAAWAGLIPPTLTQREHISRGEVFSLAATADRQTVFAASFVWGTGDNGYGPHRYGEIVDSTHGRLDDMLRAAGDAAADDVIAGYAMFFGGHDPKHRASPNTDPWTRIEGFGPAFFTKFLYFTHPGALILDNVLAKRVKALSAMPYLVQANGQSYPWSPYRYAVYLHWMPQTATRLGCGPDELEVTLFAPPTV